MDEHERDKIVRSEFGTRRPASSMPTIIAVALIAMLVGLVTFQVWPGDTNRTAVTDSSPRVERVPTTPPIVKAPSDLAQPVPKSPK